MLAALAVNATFSARGEAASYTPPGGGAATPCTVIVDARDRQVAGTMGRQMMQGVVLKVRKSEIAGPASGGIFVLSATGEILEVKSDPECFDAARLVWTFTVA